jgi:glycosyltransferase involved in cell wall biosynthesis
MVLKTKGFLKELEGEYMRIIHVEDYFDPTAGYQINELLLASREFDHQVFLITSNDMTPFHKEIEIDNDKSFEKKTGVKIIRLEKRLKLSNRILLKNLRTTIEEIQPDIVFMHGIGDFKDLQLWKKKAKYKIIRDCHMSWVASKNKFRHFFYFAYRALFASIINRTNKYDIIYALGEEEYEYLINLGINSNKIDYLLHGYSDSIMYYQEDERKRIRQNYNFGEGDIVISYVGKFNFSKRPDLIIDIVDMLDEEYITCKNLKLLFLGPKNNSYMKQFHKKLDKIKNKIPIVIDSSKPFEELGKYYSASDICIFPKETSLSSIHAQVCGCPVIMENHKSNKERVINKNNLYQTDNLSEASIILKRVVENKEFIKSNRNKLLLEDREYKNQIKKFVNRVVDKKWGFIKS